MTDGSTRAQSSPTAHDDLRYSVVVPVYNEADNIVPLLETLRDQLPPRFEIVIVYDFDEDSTLPAIDRIPTEKRPANLRTVKNTMGKGVRFAIEVGMRSATAPIVMVTMADLSDDYSRVEEMISLAEDGADVVCASRYMRGGRQVGGPFLKSLLSRTAGLTLHWFAGMPTHDATNSFRVYRKDFLDRMTIESTAGFCLALELTVKAHAEGRRIEEVPATWHDRSAGESRFRTFAWMPHYLKWYLRAFGSRTGWRSKDH